MKIFISYSTQDKKIVKELSEINSSEVYTWIDHKSLGGGSILNNTIKKGIESSDMLFLFISQESLSSKWVKDEIKWAIEREKKLKYDFIVPVVLEQESWDGWRQKSIKEKKYILYDDRNRYRTANEIKDVIIDKTIERFKHHCVTKKSIVDNMLITIAMVIATIAFLTTPSKEEHIKHLQSKVSSLITSEVEFEDFQILSVSNYPISNSEELLTAGAFGVTISRIRSK